MKLKFFILILAIATAGSHVNAAVNAATFMKEASAALTSSQSVTASFKIVAQGQNATTGSISVKGNKFAVKSTANTTIYDGKTQWTISADDKEISVFEPTADEIAQVNPFAIINSYAKYYNVASTGDDASNVKIKLTPKSAESNIKNVVITFAASTKLPKAMVITLDDGTALNVTISNVNTRANIQASTFVVTPGNYPGYEVIDMR